MRRLWSLVVMLAALVAGPAFAANPQVEIETTAGRIKLELYPEATHLIDWFHLVRQEAVAVIVRHGIRHDRTWCPITSTLGGDARR